MPSTSVTFSSPTEEITYLKEQIQQLTDTFETKIRLMQHQMDEMIKRLYGRSSEKLDPSQLLFQEVLLEAEKLAAPAKDETIVKTVVKEHVRHKHGRSALPEHLPRVEHMMDIKDEAKVCGCGKPLKHIGDDVTERIDHQPASLHVNVYRRPKYACPDCNCDGCGVKQAPPPEGPIDRCEADSGMLAYVIVEKYEHHTPLARQEEKFARQGVNIGRQTLGGWCEGSAVALMPLYDLIRQKILEYPIALNDDTPVQMRYGPALGVKEARFWATVGGEELKYIAYDFTTGRNKEGPVEFFNGYKGVLLTDDYAGYNDLFKPDKDNICHIINAGCWTHARRYFIKAEDTSPRAAMEMLILIAQLYKIEKENKRASAQERLAARQKEAKPIIEKKIKPWLEANMAAHLPQSPISKAIHHMLGIWKELNVYLQDGRIPIDNNLCENAIRSIALGRKNWLFIGSETGGHTAAVLMTFTATCHKLKINTWAYLRDVLQRINAHPASRLHELLPDQWQAAQDKI